MGWKSEWQRSIDDPEGFWMDQARTIEWDRAPSRALHDLGGPVPEWYADGLVNTCWNAVDRHVVAGHGDRLAVIYDSPVTGIVKRITYAALQDRVARLAGALTAGSCGIEPGRIVPYKPLLDAAIAQATHKPEFCVILQREQGLADMTPRDTDWEDFIEADPVECVPVAGNHPAYILYTSGTTGAPKGVVRATGGHLVALDWSMANIYGVAPGEVFWAASDVGWVVGHSYICYAPLIHGATTIVFEGKRVDDGRA